ncbi:ATP-binding protein [uncultured Winogradskyella sp.]|uniref:ATP-binding response regulator n=1 Tax=uncultured Winogradskyella sp. TaxID=395353 RepID=UPI00261B9ACD|nr:ATP-binding protein [uncultured Winogradskyella sp.]
MSTLSSLRASYIKKNTQFILVDVNGEILDSDDILFKCETGCNIEELHPIFIGLIDREHIDDQNISCVHLKINKTELICDILLKKSETGFVIIVTDFSIHYNSFQSLAQSRNETAITSELIYLKNNELNEIREFKNKFLENFNHQLVSPVLSILTFSDALTKTKLTSEQKSYSSIIATSADMIKNMINDTFDIAKIETGNLEIIQKRFSLKKLMKDIVKSYEKKSKLKHLAINSYYVDSMPDYIVSDKLRIGQIINNLLDNAIKYTNSGEIIIKTEPVYKRARKLTFTIKIIDTGIGIDTQHQDSIFDRFTRIKTNSNIQGNGLGLAIAKDLAKLLNGEIEFKSELGVGSEFTFTLRTTTPLKSPNKAKIIHKTTENTKKTEILLIDNNTISQLNILKILANTKAFFVDIVSNAKEAEKSYSKKHYDLILINYKLDTINGLELSKVLNKDKTTNILLLTSLKIKESVLKQYSPYINYVLQKPFDPQTLIDSIEMCIK